ncbi:hypothetical protein CHRYSEOSP005_03850 [Chryseobacterium sp. Alg-005]|uniref:DUF6056 family protein n=1 Tax=Chryseobacterium sp. Alg-005 TaxID=3159516 RepID=UPI0035557FC1
MNSKYLSYFVLAFINICFILSVVFYPPLRDELYYLAPANLNVFQEYYNAYLAGNPRIGQFFCNAISRNMVFKVIFELALFNGFITGLFLLVFRKLPALGSKNDLVKLIIMTGGFVFLIRYFGEMFYYTPFSTNYSFSVIIYMVYIYIMSEYYWYENNILKKYSVNVPVIILFGIFTGMCNEHVPPVLIGASLLAAGCYVLVKKRMVNYKILIAHISLIIGYLLLFFAPANRVKFKVVGKESYGFNIADYLNNFKSILNLYRYYNPELVALTILSVILAVLLYRKKIIGRDFIIRTSILLILGLLCVPIIAYSPLLGTRLLFFTNTMLFVVVFSVFFKCIEVYQAEKINKGFYIFTTLFSVIFFMISVILSYNGGNNYLLITSQIAEATRSSKSVVIQESFNFHTPAFGHFNRRIFLENGKEYIDDDVQTDTNEEKNLKGFYQLNNLGVKKR